VLFSIRISPNKIDEIAHEMKIMVNLTVINSDLQVKTPFIEDFKDRFNMFDSRERIEAVLGILEQEFDFINLSK
jgi:hypothetical protein